MRRTLLAMALILIAVPASAAAAPPTRVTIVAVFDPLTYGETAYVNGQLVGEGQAGQIVALEQAPPPFTEWTPVLQTTSDWAGYYSFKAGEPSQSMQYRTVSQGVPSEKAVQVSVAPRIRLTATTAGKTSVRFSGSIAPAFDGQRITLQRRSSSGWTTIANPRLKNGRTFAGRIRARHQVKLRAYLPGDFPTQRLASYSRAVTVTPVAARSADARDAADARADAAACAKPRITRIRWVPDPPLAREGATLRVGATLPGGRLRSIDVRWGHSDARDHFALAPALRRPVVRFSLRHLFPVARAYRVTVRVSGVKDGCRTSVVRIARPAVAAPR